MTEHSLLFEHEEGSDLYKNIRNDVEFNQRKEKLEKKYAHIKDKHIEDFIAHLYKESCKFRNRLEEEYAYVKDKHILDKNFIAHFRGETINRILELDVAFLLYKSCEDLQITVSNGFQGKKGGPDFKIEYGNYRIFIECVCAHDAEEDNVEQERIISHECHTSYTSWIQEGLDTVKMSRISSAILSKAEKIRKYKEDGIIKDQDIVFLVVGNSLTKDAKMIPDALWEFEKCIAHKKVVEYSDIGKSFIKFEEFKDEELEIFKKNGEGITMKLCDLDQFNGFIYASTFSDNKNLDDAIFKYHVYLRRLPFESIKEVMGKIFHTECVECNRYLYRVDGHKSCSEEAIYQAHNKA